MFVLSVRWLLAVVRSVGCVACLPSF